MAKVFGVLTDNEGESDPRKGVKMHLACHLCERDWWMIPDEKRTTAGCNKSV